MAFGIADFGEFLIRPFTNWIGWIFIILAIIWIYLRLTGKIGGTTKGPPSGGSGPDYTIK